MLNTIITDFSIKTLRRQLISINILQFEDSLGKA